MKDEDLRYRLLETGDPAPLFRLPLADGSRFIFDSAAGRYILLSFFGAAASDTGRHALRVINENRRLFDDERLIAFGVSIVPGDAPALAKPPSGIRHFIDSDLTASIAYGASPAEGNRRDIYNPRWVLLDRTLRVMAVIPFAANGSDAEQLGKLLKSLPPLDEYAGIPVPAPILVVPNVFEPDLCRHLIACYEQAGGQESGVMQEANGRTVMVMDHTHKRRSDFMVEDEADKALVRQRILRRVVPEIQKVHQFETRYIERYLVGCYDSATGGHFGPHRDNTTRGTAHRRFAVSINLNNDFDGGAVSFPEYGSQGYKAPAGTAVVFSCSLLHAVSPVTRGRRYAFLPFVYDEAAAKIREENIGYLDI